MSVSTDLVSAKDVSRVRGWTDEPTSNTYSDDDIKNFIVEYAFADQLGTEPQFISKAATSTSPPEFSDTPQWIPTFDLREATGQIWEEKAAIVSKDFKFSADGGNYSREQVHDQYMENARYHQARRRVKFASVLSEG